MCVEMIFQMGLGDSKHGFLSFKEFLKAVKVRDWCEAAEQMLASVWAKKTPKRAIELAIIMRRGFV